MKKTIFIIAMVLSVYSVWAQNTVRYQISDYYNNKENLTHTVNYVVVKWTSRTITTPYHTRDTIYGIEIELFQTGNNTPVERIILENGTAGGNRISFEKAFFTGREESQQEFVAIYSESYEPGFSIWVYEANNIGPNTEIISLHCY
jgi:hypothetical protein